MLRHLCPLGSLDLYVLFRVPKFEYELCIFLRLSEIEILQCNPSNQVLNLILQFPINEIYLLKKKIVKLIVVSKLCIRL